MTGDTLVEILNTELDTNFPVAIPEEQLVEKLSLFIEELIRNDFQKLVAILYRVDVSEKKLRQLLLDSEGENSASIISALIIERQLQKIESRKIFSRKPGSDTGEERW